ncbi:MAG: DUF2225 domain-containing protein [Bacillota bacterium]
MQEFALCRRCGARIPAGGVAGYCPDCARELVAHIKKVMPPDSQKRVIPAPPGRSTGSRTAGGLLYTTRERCPVCSNTFSATRVAMSRLRVEERGPDFYVRYSPLDPNLYQVWVCPVCGYAAPQGAFAPLFPDERERVAAAGLRLREQGEVLMREILSDLEPAPPAKGSPAAGDEASAPPAAGGGTVPAGGGEAVARAGPAEAAAVADSTEGGRPPADVVTEYRRALYFARCRRLAHGIAAGLYLRLGWIYRARGDTERDGQLCARALDEYMQAYEGEDGLPGNMDQFAAAYLLGVLSMRLGRVREAAHYLGQVVSPRSGAEPAIRKMAQDQWYELQRVWQSN